MCGIAGIIGRLDDANRAALERMNNAMIHRGPDASGTWISAADVRGWGALLAHRRLAPRSRPGWAQHRAYRRRL
jgi:asparagine synthase (glutamine-hydrolysing)